MQILKRDSLRLGGFAGLKEHQLVTDRRVFRRSPAPGGWDGLGDFVYLADARFMPKGETTMHPHHEIDVISVMAEGRIAHEGSLEHGKEIVAGEIQVQRAGGEGFTHNEINPDNVENRMIQLWVRPETKGEPAGYMHYQPEIGELKRIYGGSGEEAYVSQTLIDVGLLNVGQSVSLSGDYISYVVSGEANVNGEQVTDGDLFKGENLNLTATKESQIIFVHLNS